ncbi:MAG: LD-carboxypeptidase [Candidatus Neomarinimicrobiota bacterium]
MEQTKFLPLLDFENIRSNPKIFLGYSDITAYLTSITQKNKFGYFFMDQCFLVFGKSSFNITMTLW